MGLNDPSKKASILRVVDVIVVRWRPDRMCDPFCEGQGSGDCSSCSGLRQRNHAAKPEITLGAPARHHAKVGT